MFCFFFRAERERERARKRDSSRLYFATIKANLFCFSLRKASPKPAPESFPNKAGENLGRLLFFPTEKSWDPKQRPSSLKVFQGP